jgi:hypothetical protein
MVGWLVGPWKFTGTAVEGFIFDIDPAGSELAVDVAWSVADSRAIWVE